VNILGKWQRFNKRLLKHLFNFEFQITFGGKGILTLGWRQSVKCKGPWGWECVQVSNTLSQMGESAMDET